MINQQYHSIISQNRRLERNLSSFSQTNIQNESQYCLIIDGILQICDFEGLKKSTKYLIKKSIDTYVITYPNSNAQDFRKAAIVFLCMVVKLNQDPILYEKLTLKWYLDQFQSGANPNQYKEFIDFELKIYNLPQFNFNFTTPYDYIGLYRQMFMLDDKLIKQLTNILDLSYTIPELMFNSAEELFVGSLVMIWQEKRQVRKDWLLNLTPNQQNSLKVAQIISHTYHSELELAHSQNLTKK